RRGSRSTSKASLEGKAFEIPTEIKPEDFDWEASRPIKPWFVRRGCSLAGHWDLAWIQVSRADVKKALCLTEEQDQSAQRAASEEVTRTSGSALDGQEMTVVSNRRLAAGTQTASAAEPGRRRGVRPQKFEQTKEAMRNDIQQAQITVPQLDSMREK